jgi:hypothetical protein
VVTDRRPEDPAPVELKGARVFVVPSRSGGRLHLVVVHDGRADCKWHGVRCWAARDALAASVRVGEVACPFGGHSCKRDCVARPACEAEAKNESEGRG